jgi:NAD(P)H-hydrate repair Nnr-like enzyme with NAD(P)H-hydrate dehydratase domain
MKGMGLALVVGGWVVAVAGLLVSDATAARLGAGLAGLATSFAGIYSLNAAHLENAIWKARGH